MFLPALIGTVVQCTALYCLFVILFCVRDFFTLHWCATVCLVCPQCPRVCVCAWDSVLLCLPWWWHRSWLWLAGTSGSQKRLLHPVYFHVEMNWWFFPVRRANVLIFTILYFDYGMHYKNGSKDDVKKSSLIFHVILGQGKRNKFSAEHFFSYFFFFCGLC